MLKPQPNNVVSAPFLGQEIQHEQNVSAIMRQVIYALIPGITLYIYYFGWGVVSNLVITCISAFFWEAIMLWLRKRPLRLYLSDGSVWVTAILLALTLPPMIVWWIPVVGSFFAVVAAKHLYGGIGYNPLNPAMAGYAVLLISFPREMSAWLMPMMISVQEMGLADCINWVLFKTLPAGLNFDALTSATPLDQLRTDIGRGISIEKIKTEKIFGVVAGLATEWINIAFLVGGLWLFFKKIVSWHIPLSILLTLLVLSSVFYFISPERYPDPMIHLLGGATILCAFFIATDPVTAATTPLGKIFFGIGVALIIYIIRTWGSYPDGVAFAVLLMNLTVPLLDQYTIPRVFGGQSRNERIS